MVKDNMATLRNDIEIRLAHEICEAKSKGQSISPDRIKQIAAQLLSTIEFGGEPLPLSPEEKEREDIYSAVGSFIGSYNIAIEAFSIEAVERYLNITEINLAPLVKISELPVYKKALRKYYRLAEKPDKTMTDILNAHKSFQHTFNEFKQRVLIKCLLRFGYHELDKIIRLYKKAEIINKKCEELIEQLSSPLINSRELSQLIENIQDYQKQNGEGKL